MDNYLASKNLKDSDNFYFNINFDLLTGCQFSCAGCHVDKDAPVLLSDYDAETLVKVLESAQESQYKPFIAFIGPTDFLVSKNTIDILSDPRVVKILSYFKRLSLQSTFLNIKNTEEIAKVFKEHYSNHEIELNILIEPDKITNIKYTNTLERNQQTVHEIFDWGTPIRNFGVMNVFDYNDTRLSDLLKDYEFMHNCVDSLFETTIDFNFSIGRKGRKLPKKEFVDSVMQIKELFDTSLVSDNKREFLRFSFGNLNDSLIERQYNWSKGKFYASPLFYERYVSFVEELEIATPNRDIKDFEQYEEDMVIKQYTYLPETDECSECPFSASCISRGILTLMESNDVTECLVARKALESVNNI